MAATAWLAMVDLKSDAVQVDGLVPEMKNAVPLLAEIVLRETGSRMVITDGTESHTTGLHPLGRAIDIRNKYFDAETRARIAQMFRDTLGPAFHVLNEDTGDNGTSTAPHWHVSYPG